MAISASGAHSRPGLTKASANESQASRMSPSVSGAASLHPVMLGGQILILAER